MDLQTLRANFEARMAEANALLAKDALTAEESTRANEALAEAEALKAQVEASLAAQRDTQRLRSQAANLGQWSTAPVTTNFGTTGGYTVDPVTPTSALAPQGQDQRRGIVPATFRYRGKTVFRDDPEQRMTAQEVAYSFGQFVAATCGGNLKSRKWCVENGIPLQGMQGDQVVNLAHSEIVNASGGFLVPPQFENQLIDLREQYGVARRIFKNRPMASDTLSIPRRSGGLTAYFVTDNEAITESTKSWNQVNLVAKKIGCLAKYSSELNEDAIIDIGNDLAQEIAYAFVKLEDDCAFNGDGTSTYGGIVGVRAAFTNLSGTIANIAGLYVGTGNAYSELTLADFNNTKSKLPKYAYNAATRWVVHQTFWSAVMERLALAAGGITDAMIVAGVQPRFLGFPVEISQQMPATEGNSQVCALLGDFSLGAAFGDRRMTTIAVSEHAGFANDQLQIRGTERFDVVVHDVGNAHGTAASRVPGPIVGLITAAS